MITFSNSLTVLRAFWWKMLIDYLNRWQINKCVCLKEMPRQRSRGANYCSSSCPGRYTVETNFKFKNDCGGLHTYNLFKSGTIFMIIYCLSVTNPESRNFRTKQLFFLLFNQNWSHVLLSHFHTGGIPNYALTQRDEHLTLPLFCFFVFLKYVLSTPVHD